MKLTLHKGSNTIGGSCVALQSGTSRILIDFGLPLVDENRERFDSEIIRTTPKTELIKNGVLPDTTGLYRDEEPAFDGILLSHSHQDHYSPFSFGTKVATTVFLYSFSGGPEKAVSIDDVKLSCVDLSAPSSIVVEALAKLKEHLFYLSDKEMRFTNKPNLNRILLNKIGNITDDQIREAEKTALGSHLQKDHLELFVWPTSPKDVPNTKGLKLVVMEEEDKHKCKDILEKCGERPRIFLNVVFFLCPMSSERSGYEEYLRRKLGWELVERDEGVHMTPDQKKEVKDRIKKIEGEARDKLRHFYRIVLLPSRHGLKEIDLGIPTYGSEQSITKEVYDRLRADNEFLERYSPLSLKEKYLKDKNHVETKKILESFFTTPGEIRIVSDDVLRESISDGVRQGLFGVGDLEKGKPICRHFKEDAVSPELVEGEVIISADLCKSPEEVKPSEEEEKEEEKGGEEVTPEKGKYGKIHLVLGVPSGKLSDITRTVNYLKRLFEDIEVTIEITARKGSISTSDYEDKIKEAITQADMKVEEEDVE